jgi:anti-sigma28 factor (negative regulator of flagellin synthesis)
MKINSELPVAVSNQASTRIDEVSTASTRHGSRLSGARTGDDLVEVSPLAEQVASASADADASQARKVDQLAAVYRSGEYRADAVEVSRALIRDAISRGAEISQ